MNLYLNSIDGRCLAMRRAQLTKILAYPYNSGGPNEEKILPPAWVLRGDFA